MTFDSLDGIISIDEYKELHHSSQFVSLIQARCGKILEVLRTSQGFTSGDGYYISPHNPLNDGTDQIGVVKTKKDVIEYIKNERWLDYEKIKNKL